MRVYYLFLQTLCFLFFVGCSTKKEECQHLIFNKTEYELKTTKLDDFKHKLSELYEKREDPSKRVMKLFWANGNLQAIIFLTNENKEGPFISYDTIGNLSYSGFFFNNKETGVSCYYDNSGEIKKFIINEKGNKMDEIELDEFKK